MRANTTLGTLLVSGSILAADGARAETTLNFLLASEAGRGLGVGFEIGRRHKFVSGIGTGFGIGHSEVEGLIATLDPGVAFGYRWYLGDWFVGPSVGLNAIHAVSTRDNDRAAERATLLFDVGYRLRWTSNPKWQTRFGLSPGAAASPDGDVRFAGALTLSLGADI